MIRSDPQSSSLLNQIVFYEGSFYPCLMEDKRLTLQEKAILMRYNFPEERIKKALEYSHIEPLTKKMNLTQKIVWHCLQPTPPVSRYKKQSYWGKNRFLKLSLLALSIVSVSLPLLCIGNMCNHPRNSFLLDKADPNRMMATDIKNFTDIANLREVNGVAISKIEARARPRAWAESGFIGEQDSLLDVLQKDWKTVDALGTTHIELADHLQAIWKIALKNEEKNRDNEKSEIDEDNNFIRPRVNEEKKFIFYDLSSLEKNTISKYSKPQKLYTDIATHMGVQEDIFCNDKEESGFILPQEGAWNQQMKLKNPSNNEKILLGQGVINYIRKYGFYEGGEKNEYRVDPIRLAAVLTGHSYCSIAKAIKQLCN